MDHLTTPYQGPWQTNPAPKKPRKALVASGAGLAVLVALGGGILLGKTMAPESSPECREVIAQAEVIYKDYETSTGFVADLAEQLTNPNYYTLKSLASDVKAETPGMVTNIKKWQALEGQCRTK